MTLRRQGLSISRARMTRLILDCISEPVPLRWFRLAAGDEAPSDAPSATEAAAAVGTLGIWRRQWVIGWNRPAARGDFDR